ncbi:MAG: hypothetical protein ACLR7U_08855 [Ruthenibacterium lactatiformans]
MVHTKIATEVVEEKLNPLGIRSFASTTISRKNLGVRCWAVPDAEDRAQAFLEYRQGLKDMAERIAGLSEGKKCDGTPVGYQQQWRLRVFPIAATTGEMGVVKVTLRFLREVDACQNQWDPVRGTRRSVMKACSPT